LGIARARNSQSRQAAMGAADERIGSLQVVVACAASTKAGLLPAQHRIREPCGHALRLEGSAQLHLVRYFGQPSFEADATRLGNGVVWEEGVQDARARCRNMPVAQRELRLGRSPTAPPPGGLADIPAAIPLVAVLAGGFASAAVGGGIIGALVAAGVAAGQP